MRNIVGSLLPLIVQFRILRGCWIEAPKTPRHPLTGICEYFTRAPRARQRSAIAEKIWYSIHSQNFGSQVTVLAPARAPPPPLPVRSSVRPHHREPMWNVTLGAFYLPKTLRTLHGKVHRMKNVFHLTQVPFLYTLVTKIQEDGRDIAVNSLELPCENS